MNFINEENGVGVFLQLLQHPLQALLEIPPVLGARQQGPHVQGVYIGLGQDVRHIAFHHPPGQAFRNGGFTHPRFTHQEGVVLAAPAQGLDDPFQFLVPTDEGINLALQGQGIQVDGVVFQGAAFTPGFPFRFLLRFRLGGLGGFADAVGDEIHDIQPGHPLLLQEIDRVGILFPKNGHQHISPGDFLLARRLDVENGPLDDPLETQGRLGIDVFLPGHGGGVLGDEITQIPAQLLQIGGAGTQSLCRGRIVQQSQ